MFITHHFEDIVPYKLIQVDGELVDSYNHALKKLIGKETALKQFCIDKRGFSPEINAELGPNYLQNSAAHRYIIVVTPNQAKADLLYDEFSFDNAVIDFVYKNYLSVISTVTRIDCLYGELNDGVPHFQGVEDCALISRVTVELDTPTPFFEQAKQLQNMVSELHSDPELLIENQAEHLMNMLTLVEQVGDIRSFNFSDIDVTVNIECFHTQFFGGTYLFRSLPDASFYPVRNPYAVNKFNRGEARRRSTHENDRNRPKSVIIFNNDNTPRPLKNVEYIHIDDTSTALLFLLHNSLATINYNLIPQRIRQLEDYLLLSKGHNVSNLSEPERHRLISQHQTDMPPIYELLIYANREYQTDNLINIPAEVQARILSPMELPTASFHALEKLLCHWWPYDIAAGLRFNKQALGEQFSELDQLSKEIIKQYCVNLLEQTS
ncbi:MAG: hypothetical protein OEZ68_18230 [Gammaproteobacteria bacterium]|nr:hypothetical protein [Gammaproteobacteria bacterium]MDH5802744.1 hypothetical protein [Gammaproteobacteria bacterium]